MKLTKRNTLLVLLPLSCIIAAIYAIINDCLLYLFCPEFFTKFKFIEYGVRQNIPGLETDTGFPLTEIAQVAIMASWWMGLIIGTTLTVLCLPIICPKTRLITIAKAMGITTLVTAVISLTGLVFGKLFLTGKNMLNFGYLPNGLQKPDDFMMAFSLHNFSYIGAITGMFVASVYIIKKKKKLMAF
ncbi:hypothetical protein AM493_01760 [Flavobacterium akiainvivens]|uniref:Uncharacterized protein n=1 Tax=Flavobacterium akiainvivens TaxID=1202724 RepID=A0A0M8MB01_9FLAO|nr:hypothetical protein [Flavobacterium akiainvivens]KOS04904.1 hypothetical protein AM493_01760 [Flavobacterium akiainvivens]SFQ42441.1 hypothetical protein SAMN05444144_104171 [Flavobacterium akiainvivens]